MRIDRIDIIRVLNPFRHPFQTSFTRFENRDALLVKIYSEGSSAGANAKPSMDRSTIRRTTGLCSMCWETSSFPVSCIRMWRARKLS